MRHPYVTPGSLNREVLALLATTHRLQRCPKCEGQLSQPYCHLKARIIAGHPQHSPLSVDDDHKVCSSCNIVWELSCTESSSYPATLPSMTTCSHTLNLRGTYNCFCRRRIFKRFWVHVETAPGKGKIKKRCKSKPMD